MKADPQTDGREVELKFLLAAEADWRRLGLLLAQLAPAQVMAQRNLYLDTPDLLLDALGVMVRIRLHEQRAVATCKAGSRLVDGLMTTGEWEAELPPPQARLWRHEPPAEVPLAALPIAAAVRAVLGDPGANPGLVVRASLDNSRQRFDLSGLHPNAPPLLGCGSLVPFELDRACAAPDHLRYELEVEHAQAGLLREPIGRFLTDNGIGWRQATETKYAWLLRCCAQTAGR